MAYRGATITLQTMPGGLKHQRTFEALASGSLVLARYAPEDFGDTTMDAFAREFGDGTSCNANLYHFGFRGLDRVVFDTPEAMERMLETYLADPAQAEEVQRELRGDVLRQFTYDQVLPGVMEWLRGRLGPLDSRA